MIRIVWGRGVGSTTKASFDSALADAGVHQYNLRHLSSVIPADTPVKTVETAPDLGDTGNALDVVIARATSTSNTRVVAGLAWARNASDGGVFYEVTGHDVEGVRDRLYRGIEQGCELRDLGDPSVETKIVTADPDPPEHTTAVVLAAFGKSTPLV